MNRDEALPSGEIERCEPAADQPGPLFRILLWFIVCHFLLAGLTNAAAAAPRARPGAKTGTFRPLTQPSFTTCGQTSVAMVTGADIATVIRTMGGRGTTAKQLVAEIRRINPQARTKIQWLGGNDPAANSIVYLRDPSFRAGHWTVFHGGVYYDPIFGKMEAYPSWISKQLAITIN